MKQLRTFVSLLLLTTLPTFFSCEKDVVEHPPIPLQVPPGLAGKEFVFSKIWDWVPDGSNDGIYLSINTLDSFSVADLTYLNLQVFMKLDTCVAWIAISEWNPDSFPVQPLPPNGYRWFPSGSYLNIYNDLLDTALIGKPTQVRVKIL